MFSPNDFDLPLEKQLRLRVIAKEIDECRDYDELKDQLKQCSEVLMKYQHLLTMTLQRQITQDMTDFISKIESEIQFKDNDT
tara:strand:+ start:42 stop:287 length:246 start_codon:yes stop_codon:yes gene_type:complete